VRVSSTTPSIRRVRAREYMEVQCGGKPWRITNSSISNPRHLYPPALRALRRRTCRRCTRGGGRPRGWSVRGGAWWSRRGCRLKQSMHVSTGAVGEAPAVPERRGVDGRRERGRTHASVRKRHWQPHVTASGEPKSLAGVWHSAPCAKAHARSGKKRPLAGANAMSNGVRHMQEQARDRRALRPLIRTLVQAMGREEGRTRGTGTPEALH
jgi:hypothetical protein